MRISRQHNNFYHLVIKQAFEAGGHLVFKELLDTRTGKPFLLEKNIDYFDLDDLKQIFKAVNFDYPIDDDGEKVSTKEITDKELVQHLEFIYKTLGENGYLIPIIEEEWQRLMNSAIGMV